MEPKTRWRGRGALDAVAAVLMSTASILLIVVIVRNTLFDRPASSSQRRVEASLPSAPISLQGEAGLGVDSAPVGILQFSEFQCPFCAAFAKDTAPELIRRYVDTGKVRLIFRHYPLDSMHPYAFDAAVAAECASQQGTFWPMHDSLFANQKALDAPSIERRVGELQLNVDAFRVCAGGPGAAKVRSDVKVARSLGVAGTPTFFVGTIENEGLRVLARLQGAVSIERLSEVVEVALSK